VRSRHYEERIDGDWVTDPSSDLGRIERQQDFIRRALSRAIDKGARNPRKLDRLINVGLDGITVDDALTANDIFRLGNRFRRFDPEDLVSYSLPVEGDNVGEAQILRLAEDEAERVLPIFRGDSGDSGESGGSGGSEESGDGKPTPASVSVQVLNGSGSPGQASDAQADLTEAGFIVSGTGEATSFDHERTVVQYPAGQRDAADLVARWLASGAVLEQVDGSDGIVVVTGEDWQGVRSEAREASGTSMTSTTSTTMSATTSTLPPSSDLSTSTTDEATSSSSTSTTLDPAAREC
jgi:polyisoprenyl-teichoic acid--peptidoglycan teichoic acid transferase